MKIVIADDSSLFRVRIRTLLESFDNVQVVGEAKNGPEAFQMITAKMPELVFMDIRMPEMNGIVLLKKIRESGLKVKTCILTNYPYPQYKKRCFEEGADFFLTKSEDLDKDCIFKILSEIKVNK